MMIDAALVQEATRERADWEDSLSVVQRLEITTEEDFAFASDLVKMARGQWKRLDARRTAITKPMLAAKRGVDELFKPALDKLSEIERVLKEKIGAYTVAARQDQEAAMTETAATFAAGGTPTEAIPEVPHAKGVTVNEFWDFEVMDPELVPRDLCSPDPAKINAAILYADTARTPPQPIPGIRFVKRTQVIVRAK